VARGETLGARLRAELSAVGFQRRGRSCYLSSEELIWVITPEPLWSGPHWAVRVALVDRWLSPYVEWPGDADAHLQTEPLGLTSLKNADAVALDGDAVAEALRADTPVNDDNRTLTLRRLAVALHDVLSGVQTRSSLATEVRAGRLMSALIVKDLRRILEAA
jgi:hypothetical protein